MRTLDFSEVRAAACPAWVDTPYVAYEYRPLQEDVVVHLKAGPRVPGGTSDRPPASGWHHASDCRCVFCQAGGEEESAPVSNDTSRRLQGGCGGVGAGQRAEITDSLALQELLILERASRAAGEA